MKIELEASDLAAIAAAVVDEIARRESLSETLPSSRLGYPEREAANLLGLPWYALRNARRRGEIGGRRIGRSVVYSRAALLSWLATGDDRDAERLNA